MKIGYIIGTYPLVTTTFIDREIQGLRERGIEIQVLSIRRPPAEVEQLEEYRATRETTTYLLPPNWAVFLVAHLFYAIARPFAYWGLLAYLVTRSHPNLKQRLKTALHFGEAVYAAFILRDRGLDRLHAHFADRAAAVALCVGRLLDRPYSLTAHANDLFAGPVLLFEKFKHADFGVTVSRFNKEYILRNYPGLDPERIIILHPWVNLDEFKTPTTRPENRRFSILSVGRLVEKKGHRFLIQACRNLRAQGLKLECRIVGSGPEEDKLRAVVKECGLADCVHLMGPKAKGEVLSLLSEADVFVLASVIAKDGDRDGMPVALAEAMAMQVPVISTDIVGISELVQPGTGLLVPPENAIELAHAIQSIYDMDRDARTKMGELGRSTVSGGFDVNGGIDQLAKLFRQSSAKKTPTRASKVGKGLRSQERLP
jgi:glycosyltransferase involved in cell wall biosynthesis